MTYLPAFLKSKILTNPLLRFLVKTSYLSGKKEGCTLSRGLGNYSQCKMLAVQTLL